MKKKIFVKSDQGKWFNLDYIVSLFIDKRLNGWVIFGETEDRVFEVVDSIYTSREEAQLELDDLVRQFHD